MTATLSLDTFRSVDTAFAVVGEDMRVHKGRSVVRVSVDGRTHYLKRYWLAPSQLFKRHVARGFHELRMIDWLNANGLSGPEVVARGDDGTIPFVRSRLFFLMAEVSDELPLERAWRSHAKDSKGILEELARFAGRLHDSGFVHTDFSERHILVGRDAQQRSDDANWTFRLIDVERAQVECRSEQLMANDLATLAASVLNQSLRQRIETDFIEMYVANRHTLASGIDFRAMLARAKPTRSF